MLEQLVTQPFCINCNSLCSCISVDIFIQSMFKQNVRGYISFFLGARERSVK